MRQVIALGAVGLVCLLFVLLVTWHGAQEQAREASEQRVRIECSEEVWGFEPESPPYQECWRWGSDTPDLWGYW